MESEQPKYKIGFIDYTAGGLTSQFIVMELLKLQEQGLNFCVFTIKNPQKEAMNREIHRLTRTIHRLRPVSMEKLCYGLLVLLRRKPGALAFLAKYFLKPDLTWKKRLRTIVHFAEAVYFLPEAIREGITHIHPLWASGPASVGLFLSEFLSLSFSFTCHAADIFSDQLFLKEKLSRAKFVVTISKYNAEFFSHIVSAELLKKVVVNYLGVDLEKFNPLETASYRFNQLLAMGQLRPKKGFDILIRACKILQEQGETFRCRIFGDGREMERLQAMIEENGLESTVKLMGFVPHERVPQLMAKSTIFVMPSVRSKNMDMDGIPVVLMEAMAMKLPVIGSAISGIPELISHDVNGLLVESGNSEALASAIKELIRNPEKRRRQAENARKTIENHFDSKANTKRLYQIFMERAVHASP